jgi:hypothetical protein
MAGAGDVPTSALLQVPSWFWGGVPARFLEEAGFEARLVDRDAGLWRVTTSEQYAHQRPSLVAAHHLAGPGHGRPKFDRLAGFTGGPAMETLASQDRGREELGKRADRAMRTEAPVDLFAFWQLQALITPRAQLPGVVAEAFAGLIEIRLKEDNSVRVFANAGVHVVRRAEELPHRVKLPGVLLRVAQDDRLRAGSLKHVRKPASAGQTLFAASEKLYDGVFIFDAYLGPLWGALTPAIWSLAAHRELGTVVYSLGQPLAGTNGDAAELLQLIPNRAPTQSVPTPKLDSGASTEALDW